MSKTELKKTVVEVMDRASVLWMQEFKQFSGFGEDMPLCAVERKLLLRR
jgi:hypothetical protein